MNGFGLDSNIISFDLKENAIVKRNLDRELEAKTKILIQRFTYYEVKRGLKAANATRQLRLFDNLLKDCSIGEGTDASKPPWTSMSPSEPKAVFATRTTST
jgi:hypothetical protein